MKKLLVVVILLIALVFLLPLWLGSIAHKKILRHIQNTTLPHVQYSITDYHQGWFHSTFKLDYRVDKTSMFFLQGLRVQAKITVYHGPFYWIRNLSGSRHFHFGLYAAKATVKPSLPGLTPLAGNKNKALIHVISAQGFGGALFAAMHADPAVWSNPARTFTVSFGPISGTSMTTNLYTQVQGVINLGKTTVKFLPQGVSLRLPAMTTKFTLHRDPSGLWYGSKEISMPQLQVETKKARVLLKKLVLTSEMSQPTDKFNVSTHLTVHKLVVGGQSKGALDMRLRASNLNTKPLASFKPPLLNGTQSNTVGLTETLRLAHIIAGSEINLDDLQLTLPDMGTVKLSGYLDFSKQVPVDLNSVDLFSYMAKMGEAKLQLDLSKELYRFAKTLATLHQVIKASPNQATGAAKWMTAWSKLFTRPGVFEQSSDGYTSQLIYQNELYFINDAPANQVLPSFFKANAGQVTPPVSTEKAMSARLKAFGHYASLIRLAGMLV